MVAAVNARRDAPEVAFTIERVFQAPRDLVWKAMTEREHLARWWGPKGMAMQVISFELKPGGIFRYDITMPGGQTAHGKITYREITPTTRLSNVVSFCDAKGTPTRHPMNPTWPLECLSIGDFTEKDGKTTMAMKFYPLDSNEEEISTFKAGHSSMTQGFGGTYAQLDAYLAELTKG